MSDSRESSCDEVMNTPKNRYGGELTPVDLFENALEESEADGFQSSGLSNIEELYANAFKYLESWDDIDSLISLEANYGEYLTQVGEYSRAIKILEKSNRRKGNVSGSYQLLIPAYLKAGKTEDAFLAADRWTRLRNSTPGDVANWLLRFAAGQHNEGNLEDAEALLLETESWAKRQQLPQHRFQAWHQRGRHAEVEGDKARAIRIYREAIKAGSKNKDTFQRLMILLQKNGNYAQAVDIAQTGLEAIDEVAWRADITARLARLQPENRPAPLFVIRRGEDRISVSDLIAFPKSFEARSVVLSPDKETLYISKSATRKNNFVGMRLNGEEQWSASVQMASFPLHALPGGGCLTYKRFSKSHGGHTELYWFNDQGVNVDTRTLPDMLMDLKVSVTGVVAGCRDGSLYFFNNDADLIWQHKVPRYEDDAEYYSRPQFVGISTQGDSVAYSTYDCVFYVDSNGQGELIWEAPDWVRRIDTFATITAGATLHGLVMSADGREIAVSANDGHIYILDTEGTVARQLKSTNGGSELAADDTLTAMAVSHWDGIDFYDGSTLHQTQPFDRISAVAVSPTGSLVVAWLDTHLHLFDIKGTTISIVEFARNITSVVFRSESDVIVAAGHIFNLKVLQ